MGKERFEHTIKGTLLFEQTSHVDKIRRAGWRFLAATAASLTQGGVELIERPVPKEVVGYHPKGHPREGEPHSDGIEVQRVFEIKVAPEE